MSKLIPISDLQNEKDSKDCKKIMDQITDLLTANNVPALIGILALVGLTLEFIVYIYKLSPSEGESLLNVVTEYLKKGFEDEKQS